VLKITGAEQRRRVVDRALLIWRCAFWATSTFLRLAAFLLSFGEPSFCLASHRRAHVSKICLDAHRELGRMLGKVITKGGDPKSHDVTLTDLGIERMESHRCQVMAKLPEHSEGKSAPRTA